MKRKCWGLKRKSRIWRKTINIEYLVSGQDGEELPLLFATREKAREYARDIEPRGAVVIDTYKPVKLIVKKAG